MLANLIRRPSQELRTPPTPGQIGWAEYLHLYETFGFNGVSYMVPSGSMAQVTALQSIRNPIILACIMIRASCFSEIRFAFQNYANGRAARDLFGTPALQILEHPWPGGSTGDLLGRMEVDASMYGNSYWYHGGQTLTWLDPTRIRIVTGDAEGPSGVKVGSKLLGYQSIDTRGKVLEAFLPDEIIHYRPLPDPDMAFRGLSWLSALLGEVTQDQDISDFKRSFLRNSATPNLVVTAPEDISEQGLVKLMEKVESRHTGPQSAFKTIYVSAGTDIKSVQSSWADMELFATQSYGDTRLAVAAGVPASLLGIAEGLKGSALNSGNYSAVRRRFSDITIRPLWRMACAAIEVVVPPPHSGTRLWYDDRDVLFVQADLQDAAAVRSADAATIVALTQVGFDPQSVVEAVVTGDFSALETTDLISVQLQPPQTPLALTAPADGADNGDDNANPDDNAQ